jgi:LPS-assembly protein
MSYSEVDGYRYSQPFFWAISDSTDATFYEDYMEHRGGKHGLEYRYVLAPGSKGAVMYDYLMDRQIDDGSPRPEDPDEYHYEGFRGDSYDRLNRDRWWFRMKSDQNLPAGFKAKLDVDLVSDQDYLREFDIGYSNYEDTDTYFSEEFGRELDDLTDTTRLNQLNVNRGWNQYSLNADIRWYDNVIMREHFEDDTTRQSLPSVTFDGSKQRIFDSPLYFDLKTSYDRYWREVGTRGHQVDLYPRIYCPVSLFKYFDFEPSAGLRGTYWRAEEHHSGDPSVQVDSGAREIYDFKADLSTEISRVFNVGGDRVDRIKHSIRPQVVYDYVPKWQRRELPDFVSSVSTNELVTYSITNNFTARLREQPRPAPETQLESEEESLPPKFSYREFCRIKLSQSYDIIEARQRDKRGGPKPFSDVKGELEFKPHEHLDLKGDVTWSPYDSVYKSYNAILSLSDDRGDRAMVDYRYASTGRRSVLYGFFVELFGGLSGYWEHERNMWDGKDIRSEVGFKYESQCWSFAVSYTHEMTMHRREYFFQIELYGLGEVGL